MNYWLDLFTGTSWREFQEAGARLAVSLAGGSVSRYDEAVVRLSFLGLEHRSEGGK